MYLREDLGVVKKSGYSNGYVETIVVGVEQLDTTFVNIYRSPSTNFEQWKEAVEWLEKELLEDPRDLMILGDLNMGDMGAWTEVEVERLQSRALNGTKETGKDKTGQELMLLGLVETNCLRQIVRGATRGAYMLDLVFCNGLQPRAVEVIENVTLTDHSTIIVKLLAYKKQED